MGDARFEADLELAKRLSLETARQEEEGRTQRHRPRVDGVVPGGARPRDGGITRRHTTGRSARCCPYIAKRL